MKIISSNPEDSSVPQQPLKVPANTVTIRLGNIPLFSGLPSETLKQLALSMCFKTQIKGDYVLHKGAGGDYLLFLLSGRLQVIDLLEDGRQIGLSFLKPGDYFGELSLVDGLPRSASVIATENSLIGLLPAAKAVKLIYTNPLVAERIIKRMARKIRETSVYRSILGLQNAYQRVFALLEHLTEVGTGGLFVIQHPPTQQEVAIMVNTSRETVSRALQVLIQNGIVEKDLKRLIIRKPDQLKAMAIEGGGYKA